MWLCGYTCGYMVINVVILWLYGYKCGYTCCYMVINVVIYVVICYQLVRTGHPGTRGVPGPTT
jgi:hypothetical protein